MKNRKAILPAFILILLLCGCSAAPSTTPELESTATALADTVNVAETIVAETEETVPVIETTEPEIKDYSIPEDFTDYYKFIGEDISVLNVDTSSWDYYNYTQPLWSGSFYGLPGDISVRLGWDDRTIVEFYFQIDEGSYFSEEDFPVLQSRIKEKFGNKVEERNISFNYSGESDYEFQLPKPDMTQVCTLGWNSDILFEYMLSKPGVIEAMEKNEKEETVPKPTKPQYDPEIGMTREEVENSRWGKPDDINKTTTKYGVSEQWVYETYDYDFKFIYFEDGIVTVIQE